MPPNFSPIPTANHPLPVTTGNQALEKPNRKLHQPDGRDPLGSSDAAPVLPGWLVNPAAGTPPSPPQATGMLFAGFDDRSRGNRMGISAHGPRVYLWRHLLSKDEAMTARTFLTMQLCATNVNMLF